MERGTLKIQGCEVTTCRDEFENKGVWCGLKNFESINVAFEYVITWYMEHEGIEQLKTRFTPEVCTQKMKRKFN